MYTNLSFGVITSLVLSIISFVWLPLFLNLSDTKEYGIFVIMKSFAHNGFLPILLIGFPLLLKRYFSSTSFANLKKFILPSLMFSAFLTAVISIIVYISGFLGKIEVVDQYLLVVFLFVEIALIVFNVLLESQKIFLPQKIVDIILSILLVAYFVEISRDTYSLVKMYYILNICKFLILLLIFFLYRYQSIHFVNERQLHGFFTYAYKNIKFIFGMQSLSLVNNFGDKYIISWLLGFEYIFIYDVINKFPKFLKTQIGFILTILLPYQVQNLHNNASSQLLFKSIFEVLSVGVLLMIFFFAFNHQMIFNIWLNHIPEYDLLFKICFLSLFILTPISICGNFLTAVSDFSTLFKGQIYVTFFRTITFIVLAAISEKIAILSLSFSAIAGLYPYMRYNSELRNVFLSSENVPTSVLPLFGICLICISELRIVKGLAYDFPVYVTLCSLIVIVCLLFLYNNRSSSIEVIKKFR